MNFGSKDLPAELPEKATSADEPRWIGRWRLVFWLVIGATLVLQVLLMTDGALSENQALTVLAAGVLTLAVEISAFALFSVLARIWQTLENRRP